MRTVGDGGTGRQCPMKTEKNEMGDLMRYALFALLLTVALGLAVLNSVASHHVTHHGAMPYTYVDKVMQGEEA
jgi:hypothetical protein